MWAVGGAGLDEGGQWAAGTDAVCRSDMNGSESCALMELFPNK